LRVILGKVMERTPGSVGVGVPARWGCPAVWRTTRPPTTARKFQV